MTAPSDPTSNLFRSWSKRIATAQAAGVDTNKIKPIFQQDYANVQRGGSALSDQEAGLHVIRALSGESAVGDPKRKTGLWGTISNIPKDMGDVTSGLAKLLIPNRGNPLYKEGLTTGKFIARNDVMAPIHAYQREGPQGLVSTSPVAKVLGIKPSEATVTEKGDALAKAMGYESAQDMRDKDPAFQDDNFSLSDLANTASRAPIARLIPGSYVAGNIGSSEGRKELQRHPVQTTLDVLPLASKAGRLAVAGSVEDPALRSAIRQGGRPARAAATEVFGEGTAKEALASGRPVRALSRVIPVGSELGEPLTLSDRLSRVSRSLGMDPASRAIARKVTEGTRDIAENSTKEIDTFKKELGDLGFTTPEQMEKLQELYTHRTRDMTLEPHVAQAFDIFDKAAERLTYGEDSALHVDALGEVRSPFNPREKPVIKLSKQVEKVAAAIDKHQAMLDDEATSPKMREYRTKLLANATAKADQLLPSLEEEAAKVPPARFIPMIAKNAQARFVEWADENLSPEAAQVVRNDIARNLDPLHVESLLTAADDAADDLVVPGIPKKVVGKIIREEGAKWQDLQRAGADPGYLPSVTPNRAAALTHPSFIMDRYAPAAYEKARATLGSAASPNALTSLSGGVVEQAKKTTTRAFIDFLHDSKYVLPAEQVNSVIREKVRAFADAHPGIDARAFEEKLRSEYQKFDPNELGMSFASPGAEYYIPKYLAKTIRDLGFKEPNAALKAANKVTGVFKRAVLIQPTFLFNNGFSNFMFAALEADGPISAARDAYHAFRDTWGSRKGEITPKELAQGVNIIDLAPEQRWKFGQGGKVRQFLEENIGVKAMKSLETKWFGLNSKLDDFYRAWGYIQEYRKTGSEVRALEAARAFYADMDDLSPIERTAIKQVIPFYSFQRHMFKFLSRYPVDHPIRTKIIDTVVRQQGEEGDLPDRFKTMFWLGKPNADGEQWGINVRGLNPFADFADNFTLAGFLNNSTPFIKAPAEAFGIDTLTASPGYTPTHYNPESGRYESGRNASPRRFIGNFIPQVEKGMDFLDPQEGRYTPSREPAALRAFKSQVNIPLTPRVYNLNRERYLQEQARIRDANNSVQDMLAGRSGGQLARYPGVVPFRGQLVSAEALALQLADYKRRLREAGYTGAPSAITPRKS